MVSEKKAQANRENSRRSTGPTSAEGKGRARLNAISYGLFSKELVVPSAGETQREFDSLRSLMWEHFQPQNALTAMLLEDLVSTHWRLQRARRCETAEIRKQRDTAWYRLRFEKISEVDSLKNQFIQDLAALCYPALEPTNPVVLVFSLEEIRKKLERNSLGLAFLIDMIEGTQEQVGEHGWLTPMDERVLINVCGVADTTAQACVRLNQIAKREIEKFKKDESVDKTTFEQNKHILSMRLKAKIQSMQVLRQIIDKVESAEEAAHLATLVMPPAECAEKIHRAEAALERRFFKTLYTLLALQGVELPR